ncbi:putative lexA repressor [Methanosarcina siciliae HI350]|uniref:Putative lexA repressor n=1 Tax=Methanosarcina siciliae HI350 TaxID=1434119 RepID=A0A0E3PD15_9EURY|nr:plasmid pRiA4b ORF-3 family protein [Methanosarcina siciliae]AKB32000.1 putative lexA repressor [Methanosarcina siciliae HI350]
MPSGKKNKAPDEGARGKTPSKLYTFIVYLIQGPMGSEFDGKTISRTIQIRGNQTLEALHEAIFKAFDRFDEHLYEFLLGVGPDDRSAVYSLPADFGFPDLEEKMAGDVRTTTIDSLGLEVGLAFGYRFDFGDDWLHQIDVIAIEDYSGKGKYPKIETKVGKSPPQYPDQDDE